MRSPIRTALGRRAITVAAVSVAALAAAQPAAAIPPKRETSTLVVTEPIPVIPCSNGADVLATFNLTRTVTVFFDQAGMPVREVRQVRFAGTLFSEDGRRSLPYSGRVHRVFDFATGLVTVTGRSLVADFPGPDPATAGKYLYDPEADVFLSERGRTPSETERRICAYLYPGS
jgi:hypothetical protein